MFCWLWLRRIGDAGNLMIWFWLRFPRVFLCGVSGVEDASFRNGDVPHVLVRLKSDPKQSNARARQAVTSPSQSINVLNC